MKTLVKELNGTPEWLEIKSALHAIAQKILPFPIEDFILDDYVDTDGVVEPLISLKLAPEVDFLHLSKGDWESVSEFNTMVLSHFLSVGIVPPVTVFIQPVLKS